MPFSNVQVNPQSIKRDMQHMLLQVLPTVVATTVAIYLLFALANAIALPPSINKWMSLQAAMTSVLFLFLYWQLRRGRLPAEHAQTTLNFGALLVLFNNTTHLWLTANPAYTANNIFLLFGFAYLSISRNWLIVFALSSYFTWEVVAYLCNNGWGWWHYRLIMVVALMMAGLIQIVRVKTIENLLRTRLALQQKHNEKEAAEAENRLKNTYLAKMSHEIRTPMTAIMGFSELLTKKLTGRPEAKHAEMIHSSGKRLLELLNNIIDLARLEANEMPIFCEAHLAEHPIQRAASLWGLAAEQKGLELHVQIQPNLWLNADPRRVEQILNNLLSNALRFTSNGKIIIRASQHPSGNVEIQVKDTGRGIAADFLPYVFDEFRQEADPKGEGLTGSGLGLAICKKLCERMRGSISINSNLGAGTTVTLLLPKAQPPSLSSTDAAPTTTNQAPPTPKILRILLIEDDPHCCRLVQEILGDNHQVTAVHNSEQALAAARRNIYDLALVDIHLRGGAMDGVQTLQQLRQLHQLQNMPAIALTAYAMKGDQDQLLHKGFNDYLAKPFEPSELERLIAKYLV